jgi:uncharacterized membrane protein YoaK (UPF0700 family)
MIRLVSHVFLAVGIGVLSMAMTVDVLGCGDCYCTGNCTNFNQNLGCTQEDRKCSAFICGCKDANNNPCACGPSGDLQCLCQ